MAGRWQTRQSEKILEALFAEPDFWPWMLDEVASGKTPKRVIEQVQADYCVTWGALWRAINNDDKRAREWADARKAQAEWFEYERIDIADEVAPDRDAVAKAKLQSDVRHSVAGSHAPSTYGRDTGTGGGGVTVNLIQFNEAQILAGAPTRVIESPVAPPVHQLSHEQETMPA
jgi:hypothetical protein